MANPLAYARIVLGALMLIVGGAAVVSPYEVARFEEMIDAIGSTRRASEIEPADWKVTVTRIAGGVLVLVGLSWGLFLGVAMLQ